MPPASPVHPTAGDPNFDAKYAFCTRCDSLARGRQARPAGRESAIKALVPGVQIIRAQTHELLAGEYAPEISIVRGAEVVHSGVWGSDAEALIEQGGSRELFRRTILVMPAGGPTIARVRNGVPDGTIIGARGPFAMFAPDTELHRWFRDAYRKRHSAAPSYPAYKMAQAILGVKSAWERAQAINGGTRPSQEQTAAASEYLSFEGPGGRVDMSLGKGHQAVQETAYGTARRVHGETTLVDVRRYPARLTTPPDGIRSEEWIRTRFAAISGRGGEKQ
jgi:branched-chain amino acid transport system substrate-binding protein